MSFALLLFLVCAAVGGVVLAAGTAAGGRISKMAEMDQRYYSVTSAAELIANELNGKSVAIRRSKEIDITVLDYWIPYRDDDNNITGWYSGGSDTVFTAVNYKTVIGTNPDIPSGNILSGEVEKSGYHYSDPGEYPVRTSEGDAIVTSGMSLLAEIAARLMFGSDLKCNTEDTLDCDYSFSERQIGETSFTLAHSDQNDLKITGTYWTDESGKLYFKLCNDDGSSDKYTLLITFSLKKGEAPVMEYTTPSFTADSAGFESNDLYVSRYSTQVTGTATPDAVLTCTLESIQKVITEHEDDSQD